MQRLRICAASCTCFQDGCLQLQEPFYKSIYINVLHILFCWAISKKKHYNNRAFKCTEGKNEKGGATHAEANQREACGSEGRKKKKRASSHPAFSRSYFPALFFALVTANCFDLRQLRSCFRLNRCNSRTVFNGLV